MTEQKDSGRKYFKKFFRKVNEKRIKKKNRRDQHSESQRADLLELRK